MKVEFPVSFNFIFVRVYLTNYLVTTLQQLLAEVKRFCMEKEHGDSAVLALLTHGEEEEIIYGIHKLVQSPEAQNGLLVKVEYTRSPLADYC